MSEEIKKSIRENGVVVISCPKRLDSINSDDLRKALQSSIDEKNFRIVIDMAATRYSDSSGLGAIVSTIAAARANKGDIRIAAAQNTVLDLFIITHLDQILKCFDDVSAAVKSYTE